MILLIAAVLACQVPGPSRALPVVSHPTTRDSRPASPEPSTAILAPSAVTLEKAWYWIELKNGRRKKVYGWTESDGYVHYWPEDQPERPPTAEIGPAPVYPAPQAPSVEVVEANPHVINQGVSFEADRKPGDKIIRASDPETLKEALDVANAKTKDGPNCGPNCPPTPPAKPLPLSTLDSAAIAYAVATAVLLLVALGLVVRKLRQ